MDAPTPGPKITSWGGNELNAEYVTYMASPEWAKRKSLFYKTHKRECQSCETRQGIIHLHHKTYERLKHEPDSDFAVLCDACHRTVHESHRQSRVSGGNKTLWEITNWSIKSKSNRLNEPKKKKRKKKFGPDAQRNYYTQQAMAQKSKARKLHEKTMNDPLSLMQGRLRAIQAKQRRSALGEAPSR